MIELILSQKYLIGLILIIVFSGFLYQTIILGIRTYRGDFSGNIDLSQVKTDWIKIPKKDTDKFLWGAIYTKKPRGNDSNPQKEDKKPYVILAHGMGGNLKDLDIMSVPLALIGYKVVAFNQSGHGRGAHQSPGNGKDYSVVMKDVHDIVDFILAQDDLDFDQEGKPRIAFIGASTGGLMALTQAYKNPSIKMTVALSGIHDFRDLLAKEDEYSLFSQSRLFLTMLKRMGVKLDYTEEENQIISPKQCLKQDSENKKRVFILHCENDPLPIEEAKKNVKKAGIPPENYLFLKKGGHAFRAQETILAGVIQKWLYDNL